MTSRMREHGQDGAGSDSSIAGADGGGSVHGDGRMFWPPRNGAGGRWLIVVLASIVLIGGFLPAGLSWYYGGIQRNLQFVIDDGGLSVQYGVGRIDIPAGDIASVQFVADPPRMRRVAGAGLSGLQMGWYSLEGFGRIYRLTTNRQNIVFVDTSPRATEARPDTRYAFNPAEPEHFVELLADIQAGRRPGEGAGAAAAPENGEFGTAVTFKPVPAGGNDVWFFAALILVLVLPVGIGLPWIVSRGQRGMRYHVGRDGITVHHLGATLYRWDSVVDVKAMRDSLPRMWRLFGAAIPGYYAGRFRAGPLGTVQVNATRLKPPVVLVETSRGNVVLSPEHIDEFLQAVDEYRGTTS